MSRKKRLSLGNRTMRQFADYDYTDELAPADRQWLEKFNQEYYGHNFSDEPVHKDAEGARAQSIARENAARRDVWNNEQIEYLDTVPNAITMDVSTSDLDYEEVYKRYGYEPALERIKDDALDDLENPNVDPEKTLNRYYHKREKLRRMNEADRRNNGKNKEKETNEQD